MTRHPLDPATPDEARPCQQRGGRQRSRFQDFALVAAIIAAIWLAAASRWIAIDAVVPWDSKNQFYAFFRFLASALHSGSTPFWNPYHYGGHPAVADPQSLVFAPLFVVWAWFDPAPSMRAFDLVVYAHLLLGGLAVAAIGRRVGWPAAACVLAAAVFMFGGVAASRLQHTTAILAYGTFPLALLLLQFALERRSYLLGFAFAFAAATLVLGRNQVPLLFAFFLVGAVVAEIIAAENRLRYLRERIGLLAAMGAAALALTLPPVLLTFQFAALSNRSAIVLERAFEASLYPVNLATLAVANVFGSNRLPSAEWPYPYWGPNYDTVPEVGATDLSFNYLFVGVATVVVVLWFGFAGAGAWRNGRRWLTAALILALLYMLGRYTPFFAWTFDWIPGVNKFRRPVDGSFVFIAALALLCGHLLADYIREGQPRLRPLPLALTLTFTALMLAWGVAFSARSGRAAEAFAEALKALALAVAVILPLALARTAHARALVAAGVAAVGVAELLYWNTASRLNAEAHRHYAVLEHPDQPAAHALALIGRAVRERRAQGERPRVEIVGVGGAWQNVAMVQGLEATNGYNPLRIGFYDRLVEPGETTYLTAQRKFPRSFDSYDCALARALGLEYVMLGRPIDEVPQLARRPVAELLLAGPQMWVYRLKGALPRVSFARRVQVADASGTDWLGQPLADPSADRVLIDDDTPPSQAYASGGKGHARIVGWRPDRVEIEVESTQGGVLALHDTYYPGWTAAVDGFATRIMRADVLFRAVEVPAGRRKVVFRFAPFSYDNLRDALVLAIGQTIGQR